MQIGRSIAAACETYFVTEFSAAERESERLAEIALKFPARSCERKNACKALSDFISKCADRGIELIK